MKKSILILILSLIAFPALTYANPLKVTTDIRSGLEQDNRVVCYNEKAYIIERAGQWASGDCTITVMPLADLAGTPEASYSVGIGANAYDIEFRDPNRAYVSRYGNLQILVIDPTDGSQLGTVDLSPYCSDPWASPSYMYMAQVVENYVLTESRLFVAVQDGWGMSGKVIVFDTMNSDAHLATINLTLSNPNADLDYYDDDLYVSCTGDYSTQSICGIEVIDIMAVDVGGNYTYPTSVLATGDQLESEANSVHDIEIVNSEWGFIVVGKNFGSDQNIAAFNPLTGSQIKTLYDDYSTDYTHEMKAYMPGYLFMSRSDKDASTGTDIPVYDIIYDTWYSPFPNAGSEEAYSITAHKDKVVVLTSNYNWEYPSGYLTSIELDNGEPVCAASQVVDFSPGSGAGSTQDNVLGNHDGFVLSLGDGGIITLGFGQTITDCIGPDFSVFENAFFSNWPPGYTPGYFCELAFVEVSTNGTDFARFPTKTLNNYSIGSFDAINPLEYFGFGGVTLAQVGVHYDLADLANDPEVISGNVDLANINYIRIVDIVGDGSTLDSYDNPIYDPYPNNWPGSDGFDLDAVEVLIDTDSDCVIDFIDNCPSTPNGPDLGTCVKEYGGVVASYRVGDPKSFITCTSDADCETTGGTCQLEQGDCNANSCGDVCECYADGTGLEGVPDGKVSAWDYGILKHEFGRYNCSEGNPCQADFNEDGKVSARDYGLLRHEFGRYDCPACP